MINYIIAYMYIIPEKYKSNVLSSYEVTLQENNKCFLVFSRGFEYRIPRPIPPPCHGVGPGG